jgi:GTP-binding protein HflX
VTLGDGERLLVTDTVGFIRKLPHDLVASFRATLEEARESELLLHIIDASHSSWEEQRIVVDDVLSDLELREKPTLHVFNKIDLLPHEAVIALQERMSNLLPNSVFISTMTEDGLEPLRRALLGRLHELRPVMELRLPAGEGKLLAEIHRSGHVLDQRSSGAEMVIRARLDASLEAKLRRLGTSMVPQPTQPS